MRKLIVFVLIIVSSLIAFTAFAFADSIQVAVAPSQAPQSTPVPTVSPAPGSIAGTEVVIAPDSLFYPIKRMIENVQVVLTFTSENKAQLLVTFANERLEEANLMTEKNKLQLVEKVMKAYVKTMEEAADRTAEAVDQNKDVKSLLESIQITEETAGKIVIMATGAVKPDIAEQLKSEVQAQVKKTLAVQAAAEAKKQFKASNDLVKQARENLKLALKTGTDTLVKTAEAELQKAEQNRDKALDVKKVAEAYKGQINKTLKPEDKDKFEENDEDKDIDEDVGARDYLKYSKQNKEKDRGMKHQKIKKVEKKESHEDEDRDEDEAEED